MMDSTGAEYIVSGVFSSDFIGETFKNQTYLNIYRFLREPTNPKYPNGYFVYGAPIDAQTLKLQTLSLADVAVIGSRIFALDNQQGIITFDYESNMATNVDQHNLTDFGIDKAWALALNYDGNYIEVTLTADSSLYQF